MKVVTTRRGVELTEVGLGVAQFGNLYRETSDEQARSALDAAWNGGIRYFDTAPHYGLGLSERRVGRLLAERPRDEFVLSSKVGRLLVPSPETADRQDDQGFAVPADRRRQWDFSRDGIFRSLDETLTRTGLDRVDVLYLHDPENHLDQAAGEAADALVELRDQGVVRAIGAGMNFAAPLAELVRRADLDIVMIAGRFTLLDQSALDELLPLAVERGIAVVAAAVYNSGLLSSPSPSAEARFDYERAPEQLVSRAIAIARICTEHGVTLPDAAIAFPLRHPAVASVVVGGRDGAQVDGTLERYNTSIPEALWGELADSGLLAPDALAAS